jgi:hypothetical protein
MKKIYYRLSSANNFRAVRFASVRKPYTNSVKKNLMVDEYFDYANRHGRYLQLDGSMDYRQCLLAASVIKKLNLNINTEAEIMERIQTEGLKQYTYIDNDNPLVTMEDAVKHYHKTGDITWIEQLNTELKNFITPVSND